MFAPSVHLPSGLCWASWALGTPYAGEFKCVNHRRESAAREDRALLTAVPWPVVVAGIPDTGACMRPDPASLPFRLRGLLGPQRIFAPCQQAPSSMAGFSFPTCSLEILFLLQAPSGISLVSPGWEGWDETASDPIGRVGAVRSRPGRGLRVSRRHRMRLVQVSRGGAGHPAGRRQPSVLGQALGTRGGLQVWVEYA